MKNVYFAIFVLLASIITAQVKEVNIDWKSIKSSEGKIKLNEVKLWGGNANSKYEFFKYPSDICTDDKGNYYIADSGENEIVVFDKNGKFIKKIGRSGSGPGDLKHPKSIDFDSKGNLLVAEEGNQRIQIFNNGKSINTINPLNTNLNKIRAAKNNTISVPDNSILNGSPKITLVDYNKNVVGKIGVFSNSKNNKGVEAYYAKSLDYALDKEGNYYIGNSFGAPVIEKYSPEGKLLMKIKFKLSAPPEEIKERGGNVSGGGGTGLRSIDVDSEGNIFVLALKKGFAKEDSKYLVSMVSTGRSGGGGKSIQIIPPKARKDKFDNFALIVFDKNGNLAGMKSLDYCADELRVENGNVFILNSYLDSVIHQYKLSK